MCVPMYRVRVHAAVLLVSYSVRRARRPRQPAQPQASTATRRRRRGGAPARRSLAARGLPFDGNNPTDDNDTCTLGGLHFARRARGSWLILGAPALCVSFPMYNGADVVQWCRLVSDESGCPDPERIRATERLLRVCKEVGSADLGEIQRVALAHGAGRGLLDLAGGLGPAVERELGFRTLAALSAPGEQAAAFVRTVTETTGGRSLQKSLQTSLRVSNWKFSHELVCNEVSLSCAALHSAVAAVVACPASASRFGSTVPDVVAMLEATPEAEVRRACIALICALSGIESMHGTLIRAKATSPLRSMLVSGSKELQPRDVAMTLANLIGEEEDEDTVEMDTHLVEILVSAFAKAVSPTETDADTRPMRSLAMALWRLSISEKHRRKLGDVGLIPLLGVALGRSQQGTSVFALRCVFQLAFDAMNKERMLGDQNLLRIVQEHAVTGTVSDTTVRRDATAILWLLGVEEPTPLASAGPVKPSVVFSHASKQSSTATRIRQSLTRAGYNVWSEATTSVTSVATFTELISAVDGALVILVGASREFSRSALCRLLAERARTQGRDIIPLLLDTEYNPSSWLRRLFGQQPATWYDFGQTTLRDEQLYSAQVLQLTTALGHRGLRHDDNRSRRLAAKTESSSYQTRMLSPDRMPTSTWAIDGSLHTTGRETKALNRPNDAIMSPSISQPYFASPFASETAHFDTYLEFGARDASLAQHESNQWDVEATSQWFRSTFPFSARYQQKFDLLALDRAMVGMLTETDLEEELGVESRLHRRAILTAAAELDAMNAPDQLEVDGTVLTGARRMLASAISLEGNLTDLPAGSDERGTFESEFKATVASCFNFQAAGRCGLGGHVESRDVKVVGYRPGSIVVDFTVLVPAPAAKAAGAAALAQAAKAASSVSGLYIGKFRCHARPALPFVEGPLISAEEYQAYRKEEDEETAAIAALRKDLQLARDQHHELEEACAEANQRVTALEGELETSQKKTSKANADLDMAQREQAAANETLAELRVQLRDSTAQNNCLNLELEAKRAELHELRDEMSRVEQDFESELDRSTTKISALEGQLAASGTAQRDLTAELATIQEQAELSSPAAHQRELELEGANAALQESLERKDGELATALVELEKAREDLELASLSAQEMQLELEEVEQGRKLVHAHSRGLHNVKAFADEERSMLSSHDSVGAGGSLAESERVATMQPKSVRRLEIEELYEQHNPDKLPEVDMLAAKYGEQRLLAMVRKKYAANQPGGSSRSQSRVPPASKRADSAGGLEKQGYLWWIATEESQKRRLVAVARGELLMYKSRKALAEGRVWERTKLGPQHEAVCVDDYLELRVVATEQVEHAFRSSDDFAGSGNSATSDTQNWVNAINANIAML
jgi:hypothetical protein